ncbi:MAG: chemotaxis protein CheW, partial [Acidimicrobiales bacterium]
ILVDEVSEVMTVDSSDIQPPPPEVVATQNRAVKGLCRVDDRLIIILDLGAVLEDCSETTSLELPPDAVARAKREQAEEVQQVEEAEVPAVDEPVGAEA